MCFSKAFEKMVKVGFEKVKDVIQVKVRCMKRSLGFADANGPVLSLRGHSLIKRTGVFVAHVRG